jgi:4-amino-4-deoxy-L-arabinose transferase-like glycosyltransferase
MQDISQKTNPYFYLVILVIICLCAFFPGLGKGSLWDRDETHYAEIAREMMVEETWTVPYFNGQPFLHKPVFAFWMIGLAYRFFGVNEFSARFFSAVFGLGTCVFTFYIGRFFYDSRAGFLSGLILATGMLPLVIFRAAVTDAYLVFFITGSIYFFLMAAYSENKGYYYFFYIMMGLGTLVKGPIGLVIPAGIIFIYLLFSGKLGILKEMRLSHGLGIITLVVLPWFLRIYFLMGDKFISDFIIKHHLRRLSEPMEGHGGPFWLYIPVIILGFFPWSAFLIQSFKRIKRSGSDAFRFLLVWFGVVFMFFSFASTKLPHYILPLFPALAIALGMFWSQLLSSEGNEIAKSDSLTTSYKVIFAVGVLLVITALAFYFIRYDMASYRLVLNMAILAGGGWSAVKLIQMNKVRTAFWVLPLTQIFFIVYTSHISIPWVERFRTVIPLAKEVGVLTRGREKVFAYDFFEPGLVFYSRRQVEKIDTISEIDRGRADRFFLFIRKKDFEDEEISPPLYLIAEKNGINEVKGDLHLMVFSNRPSQNSSPVEG